MNFGIAEIILADYSFFWMAHESKRQKRSVGRPPSGKVKLLIVLDPEIRDLIDAAARNAGLARSAYIEACFRGVKFPKF